MSRTSIPLVDINRPSTWVKYQKNLCRDCQAKCCSMPVEMKIKDLIRLEVIDEFESLEPAKKIARRLKKEGIIDRFNHKRQIFTLARLANSDCIYLHPRTRACTVYDKRPQICRNHPQVGPRPGYCAYQKRGDHEG